MGNESRLAAPILVAKVVTSKIVLAFGQPEGAVPELVRHITKPQIGASAVKQIDIHVRNRLPGVGDGHIRKALVDDDGFILPDEGVGPVLPA